LFKTKQNKTKQNKMSGRKPSQKLTSVITKHNQQGKSGIAITFEDKFQVTGLVVFHTDTSMTVQLQSGKMYVLADKECIHGKRHGAIVNVEWPDVEDDDEAEATEINEALDGDEDQGSAEPSGAAAAAKSAPSQNPKPSAKPTAKPAAKQAARRTRSPEPTNNDDGENQGATLPENEASQRRVNFNMVLASTNDVLETVGSLFEKPKDVITPDCDITFLIKRVDDFYKWVETTLKESVIEKSMMDTDIYASIERAKCLALLLATYNLVVEYEGWEAMDADIVSGLQKGFHAFYIDLVRFHTIADAAKPLNLQNLKTLEARSVVIRTAYKKMNPGSQIASIKQLFTDSVKEVGERRKAHETQGGSPKQRQFNNNNNNQRNGGRGGFGGGKFQRGGGFGGRSGFGGRGRGNSDEGRGRGRGGTGPIG
jgi:uncharacterized membrane protein YgcG